MGWSGGSELAEDIWKLVRKHIPKKDREQIALTLVDLFEQQDCDTMHECERLMMDAGIDIDDEDY